MGRLSAPRRCYATRNSPFSTPSRKASHSDFVKRMDPASIRLLLRTSISPLFIRTSTQSGLPPVNEDFRQFSSICKGLSLSSMRTFRAPFLGLEPRCLPVRRSEGYVWE